MPLPSVRPFNRPNRRRPEFQYGVILFVEPGDHTQQVEIQRAIDSGGSPGSWVSLGFAGPFPRGGGYYIDFRQNNTITWWYRARHPAGDLHANDGAFITLASAVSMRQITDRDIAALGNDAYPSGVANIDVTSTGTTTIAAQGGSWVRSWKWAASLSAFPTEATARSGTAQNGRTFSGVSAGVTPALNQTVYVTLIPYSDVGGTGAEGPSIQVQRTRQDASEVPQVVLSVDNGTGDLRVAVDGPQWMGSIKFASSSSAFPSEATVLASGATQNGRSFTLTGTLAADEDYYLTAIPFSGAGATGTQGQSFHGHVVRVAGPEMDVIGTAGTTSFTITYSVNADTFEYQTDGGGYGAVPGSGFTVSRNLPGGADKVLTFRAARGGTQVTSMITVPPQVGTSASPPIVNNVHVTSVNNTTEEIVVAWDVQNLGSYTQNLLWSLGGAYHGANAITEIAGISSPYTHNDTGTGGHGLDLVNGGTVESLFYQIAIKDGSTVMAMSEPFPYQVDHA
jgi:hypothetical protein